VARVKAVLRRTTIKAEPTDVGAMSDRSGKYVEYDGLLVNITNYTVIFEDKPVEMPPKELELLYFLASQPNQVFTRDQLLDRLWGYEYIGDSRTVDVHIKRLREKLNDSHDWSIATVWGKGYKFEVR
jgi:DNA-binding response OmpR family regulator